MVVYPIIQAVYLSTTDISFINPVPKFIGLKNYVTIFKSETFWQVLKNTLVWTISVVLLQLLSGLATALLLNSRFVGGRWHAG